MIGVLLLRVSDRQPAHELGQVTILSQPKANTTAIAVQREFGFRRLVSSSLQ
jgi:hypothetical protein